MFLIVHQFKILPLEAHPFSSRLFFFFAIDRGEMFLSCIIALHMQSLLLAEQ